MFSPSKMQNSKQTSQPEITDKTPDPDIEESERSYYYDDAHGYEDFDAESEIDEIEADD